MGTDVQRQLYCLTRLSYLSETALAEYFQEVEVVHRVLSEPRYAGGRRHHPFGPRMVPVTVGTDRPLGAVRGADAGLIRIRRCVRRRRRV